MKNYFKNFLIICILCFVFSVSLITNVHASDNITLPPGSVLFPDKSKRIVPDDYSDKTIIESINKQYINDTYIYDLWQQGYYGKGVKIAVIDSGVSSNHEDLNITKAFDCFTNIEKGCVETENDTDSTYHGTHVSGIINAQHNNKGIDGVAPLAELYSLKISIPVEDKLAFNNKAYSNAIDWAIKNNIQIINFSMGFDEEIPELTDKINTAINNGILVVVSAGNEGSKDYDKNKTTVSYPANMNGVIAVSATTDKNHLRDSSSLGPEVFIASPGTGINSTVPIDKDNDNNFRSIDDKNKIVDHQWDNSNPEGYQQTSGTSMAAPIVAGTLALLKEKYPDVSSESLKEYLRFMAYNNNLIKVNERIDPTTKQVRNDEFGYGFLQAEVGTPTEKRIILNKGTKIYNLPNDKYYAGASLTPQTVMAVRQGDKGSYLEGWFEIQTWLGYRWIKPSDYYEEINLKLTFFEQNTLYSDINKSASYGALVPQTVTATKRIGEWFEINTYLGKKWINPIDYTIGDFTIRNYNQEKLYDKKDGAVIGAISKLQNLKAFKRDGNWYEIQSYLGNVWINPTEYKKSYPLVIKSETMVYTQRFYDKYQNTWAPYNYTTWAYEKTIDGWFTLGALEYVKPIKYFMGEYKLKLTEPITYLYSEFDNLVPPAGKLSPQTVTVVKKEGNGFLIKTSIGEKWCFPKRGTYIEFQ